MPRHEHQVLAAGAPCAATASWHPESRGVASVFPPQMNPRVSCPAPPSETAQKGRSVASAPLAPPEVSVEGIRQPQAPSCPEMSRGSRVYSLHLCDHFVGHQTPLTTQPCACPHPLHKPPWAQLGWATNSVLSICGTLGTCFSDLQKKTKRADSVSYTCLLLYCGNCFMSEYCIQSDLMCWRVPFLGSAKEAKQSRDGKSE